jgi:hypothetical protein
MKFILFILIAISIFSVSNCYSQCVFGDCKGSFSIKKYPDSSRFEGLFQNGKKICGVNYYKSGSLYKGNFQDNKKHGEGLFIYQNTDTFQGVYANDSKYYGEYKFKNGSVYKGFFLNDKQHGHADFKDERGVEWDCEWKDGNLISKNKLTIEKDSTIRYEITDKAEKFDEKSLSVKPKMYAVLVGVSSYLNGNNLRYSDDDAALVYKNMQGAFKRELADGKIEILLNDKATVNNVLNSINNCIKSANENDYIVFYFSGHGSPGAFCGYDGLIDHKLVSDVFTQSKAKYKLCIADACFSGSISQTQIAANHLELNKDRMCVLMSSKSNQTSIESSGINHGIFSYHFVKGMHGRADINKDKYITVGELFLYVKKMVSKDSRNQQIPVVFGNDLFKIPLSHLR